MVFNLLEPLGFEIIEALNGQQGFEQAELAQPDLIITDLVMPVMDGFELMTQLRRQASLKTIPIIASSASVFEVDQHKSLDAGADEFLSKPVQADELIDMLKVHLGLTWTYEAPSENSIDPLTEPSVVINDESAAVTNEHPPADIVDRIRALAAVGDLDGVVAEAEAIAAQHSQIL